MNEELDFIQPKKVVGEMISMSVIEDIKAEIKEYRDACSDGEWDYQLEGKIEAYTDALAVIDEHISGKEQE